MDDREFYIQNLARSMRPEAFDLSLGSSEAAAYAYELAEEFYDEFVAEYS